MKYFLLSLFILSLFLTCHSCSDALLRSNNASLEKKLYERETKISTDSMSLKNSSRTIARLKTEKDSLEQLVIILSDSLSKISLAGINSGIDSIGSLSSKKYVGKEIEKQIDIKQNYSVRMKLAGTTFDAYIVNDPKDIQLFWQKSRKVNNLGKLQRFVAKKKQKLIFGMNAGIFQKNLRPEGLLIKNGAEIAPLNEETGYGNFYLKPNGVFSIGRNGKAKVWATEAFKQNQEAINFATQSGPMLVINGAIHQAFNETSNSLYIRNGVGVDDQGRIVFLISNAPINLYTFASIFKEHFHCDNALYLDGAISKAFIPALNRMELDGVFGPMIGVFETEK